MHGSELGLLNTRYGCVTRGSCGTPDSGSVSCLCMFCLLLVPFSFHWVAPSNFGIRVFTLSYCNLFSYLWLISPWGHWFFSDMGKRWIWGKKRWGTTGRRRGRGNCGQDIKYERRIREIVLSYDAILKTIFIGIQNKWRNVNICIEMISFKNRKNVLNFMTDTEIKFKSIECLNTFIFAISIL